MLYNFNFKTPLQLLDYCAKNKPSYFSKHQRIDNFTVLENWDEVLDVIQNGWAIDRSDVANHIDLIIQNLGSLTWREEYINSTTGLFFDIGLVCQGKPECWFTTQETDEKVSGKKIIKIGFNVAVSSNVSIEAIIERGSAVLALIKLLEQMGRKVELIQYCSLSKNTYTFNGSLTLKTAEQNLDVTSLIFWLTCPDSYRRCWFRVMENVPYARRFGCLEQKNGAESYGTPNTDFGKQESDIFISGIDSRSIWSRGRSIMWLRKTLQAQGLIQ